MSSIRKAILYSALGQYSVHILNFITVIVLSRIITPAEIGVFAVAGSVSLLATELRSMGVVQFLIREKELNDKKIRTALGVTITVSWGLGIIIIALAPFIADFYEEAALRNILWILSSTFFIGPFTSVPIALWIRDMQFQSQFVQKLLSAGIGSGCTILFVLYGYSYYGLAMGAVVGITIELIVAIYLKPAGTVWLPSFSWVGELVKFGLYTTSNGLFFRFSQSIPDLVIGRMASMADVGLFSRGLGVILFINRILLSAISPVVLPHLSKVNRSGKSVSDAYLRANKLQAAICWPVFAVVSVAAYPMIRVLFGDQWDLAVPIASILTLWVMLTTIHCYATEALIAMGGERLVFLTGFIVFIFRFAGVLITVPHGLEAIAWSIVFSGAVEFLVKSWTIKKVIGTTMRDLFIEFTPNIIITFICWLTVTLIDQLMPFDSTSPWLSILVIALCLPPTWLLLLRITKHEAWDIVIALLNRVAHKKTAS